MLLLVSAALAGDFAATDYTQAPKQLSYEGHLAAPPDEVFAALADYEGMSSWMPKVSHVEVDNSQATTDNGVGCERVCTFNGKPLNEKIVWYSEGQGIGYTVVDGPVDNHLGYVTVQSDGAGGTDLVWDQYFEVNSMKSRMMRKMMPKLLDEAVTNLDAQLTAPQS